MERINKEIINSFTDWRVSRNALNLRVMSVKLWASYECNGGLELSEEEALHLINESNKLIIVS